MDADGIIGRYGSTWKETIGNRLADIFRRMQVAEPAQARELEEKLTVFEREMLRGEGHDPAKWGEAVSFLRASTTRVLTGAEADLFTWTRESLENPARGLRVFLEAGGYLHVLMTEIQGYRTSLEEGHVPEFDRRREEAERDGEYLMEEKQKAVQDLRTAINSKALRLFFQQEQNVETLLKRLQDAEEQYALAVAETYLLEEGKKVAHGLESYLAKKKAELATFADTLRGLQRHFEDKRTAFLNFGEGVLFVRHFNESDDWGKFYTLYLANEATPKAIDGGLAHRKFLDWLTAKRTNILPIGFSPPASLLDIVDIVAGRKGDSEVRKGLEDFSEEKFREDYKAPDMSVLEHPQMANRWSDSIEKLTRCALPMARREDVLAGGHVATQSLIYIQMAKDPSTDEKHRRFYDQVCNLLVARGYNRGLINYCLDDRRPSEVCLYIVSYAFPLPSLPVVKNECHHAYYNFYRALIAGQIGDQRNHIPLHLSKEWDGKFGDLKVYDDKEAREIKGALEILLFGSILRVLDLRQKEGLLEFGYRKWVPPSPQRESLGNRLEAIDTLKGDQRFREQLLKMIRERENGLTKEQLQDYYWLLAYLSRNSNYPSGMPEKVLLDTKLGVIFDQWFPQKGVNPEGLKGLDSTPAGGLPEGEEDKRIADLARQKLGDRVLWIGSFPVMKELDLWVRR